MTSSRFRVLLYFHFLVLIYNGYVKNVRELLSRMFALIKEV